MNDLESNLIPKRYDYHEGGQMEKEEETSESSRQNDSHTVLGRVSHRESVNFQYPPP